MSVNTCIIISIVAGMIISDCAGLEPFKFWSLFCNIAKLIIIFFKEAYNYGNYKRES